MPKVYDSLGIRFQYPDNWSLDEGEALAGNESVAVYSPGGAFWSVAIHPANADGKKLIDAALKAMRDEYQDLDAEDVEDTIHGEQAIGYDINFVCLDLTNTAIVRCVSRPDFQLLIFYQAEDREYEEIEPVFRAMTLSLLRGK